jgi:hypothetical protein
LARHVLIVGSRIDPHVVAVRDALVRRGRKCAILDRYSPSDTIVISPEKELIKISCAEGCVETDDIASLWWRLKKTKLWQPAVTDEIVAEEFASLEWNGVLFSLSSYLGRIPWVNPAPQNRLSASKPHQLRIARRIGIQVPETIFSNCPAEVSAFLKADRRHVYKQISNFMFPPDQFVFTTEVRADDVRGEDDSIRAAPGIYQELVEKAAEWRVTIIGTTLFCVRIDSQGAESTKIDWRRDQRVPMYSLGTLDSEVTKQLLAVHRELGLVYGAYDLIERPDGEIVFLECNPDGQWLWLESATGAPIADCLAEHLIQQSKTS